MNARQLVALASAAVVVAAAAVWVSLRSGPETPAPADRPVLPSLTESLDSVSEVRISRGDGTATTLERRNGGWFVAQRNYPADPGKLRTLLINLSGLREIEQKTSDPARYATLNVEDSSGAQSHSVRIDVTAGARSWSLLLGKAAEPDGSFVRLAGAAAAVSAKPRIEADPQPARWITPKVLDLAADRIQYVAVRPTESPSYWLARDARGVTDFTLHGVPAGRKPAGAGTLDAIAGTLARLNADDVKERAPGALAHPSQASFRTFEGLQLDLDGYRDGTDAWIRMHASVDQATARRFAPVPTAAAPTKTPEQAKAADQGKAPGEAKASEQPKAPETAKAPEEAKTPDAASEAAAINTRLQAYDFKIPAYQYDQIFRRLPDLLAPLTPSAAPAASKAPK
jgi:hypothetical protein